MIRLLIIDDENQSKQLLHQLVTENYDFEIYTASNLKDGVSIIKRLEVNIVLCDINMPKESGLEINKYFEDGLEFSLIFVTAYDQFAIEAFKTNAIDYILKPVDVDELYASIDRALDRNNPDSKIAQNLGKVYNMLAVNKIKIQVPKGFLFISPDDVIYFEADGSYTLIHLNNSRTELISKPLRHFADQLLGNQLFFRPQRSFLINLRYMKEVKQDDALFIIMENNKLISVSRDRKKDFLRMLETRF